MVKTRSAEGHSVDREEFLKILHSVRHGVSPKAVIEQSDCFVLRGGVVYTYNEEICCRAPSGLPAAWEGAVKASALTSVLERMSEETILLSASEGHLEVRGKRKGGRYRFHHAISLGYEEAGDAAGLAWRALPAEFEEAVQVAHSCVGKDEQAFHLTCVRLAPKWVESCDNDQMVRYAVKPRLGGDVLVRRESAKAVSEMGAAEACLSEGWAHFRSPVGVVLSCRAYPADGYPDLGDNLEVRGQPVGLPAGLEEAVGRAAVMSAEDQADDKVVVRMAPGLITVTGSGVSGEWTERRSADYKGEPLSFRVPPELLSRAAKFRRACEVSERRLRMDGERFVYVCVLHRPKQAASPAEARPDE